MTCGEMADLLADNFDLDDRLYEGDGLVWCRYCGAGPFYWAQDEDTGRWRLCYGYSGTPHTCKKYKR